MSSTLRLANTAAVEPRLLSRQAAAAYLSVCERTVRNLARRGELPEVRLAGRVLYDSLDLDALIERQKSASED
ncbi:MAG: helix-turn-helix domain-containing protein [Acidobacteriales bacterium]|nr:helix-turn-helix domain-containing protein [Terriglobales bacterium]